MLEQPIWAGGRLANGIRRARANFQAGSSAVREAQQIITLRTVQAYYDLAISARRETILTDGLEQHRLLVETIRRRVMQEVSPRSDLELALSRTAQIEQELAAANGAQMAAYSRILELVGDSAIDLGPVPVYDPLAAEAVRADAIEQALACSPTIERLRHEFSRAEAERKVAKSSLFPQIVGQLSHNEITGSRAGVTLRMQTGNGLSQLAAVSSADARIDGAAQQIATAERELREALRLDFVDNDAARSRAVSGARAESSAMLVTESYKRQFLAGRRTWLDVMNAVREATTSRLSVADAQVAAMASAARISLRTCRWQPGIETRSESEGQP